jgi:hypothetical protein
MHPMTSREQIAVRLSPAGLTEVRRLAGRETEGNVSQMIRKLLGEALAARKGQRS